MKTVGIAAAVVAALALFHGLSRCRSWQAMGDIVVRGPSFAARVALTFDDGPTPRGVAALLPVLQRLNVRATFFLTGQETQRHRDAAAALVAAGHELGNHSYSHRRLVLRSPRFVRSEIDRTDAAIRAAGYIGPIPFRAPYGKKLLVLPFVLRTLGRANIMWSVAPDSDTRRSSDEIVAETLEQAQPGSIILLHPMYESRTETRRAVEPIIVGLRQRGLEVGSLGELLSQR